MIAEKPLIVQIKEDLEDRSSVLRSCLLKPEDQTQLDKQMINELQFIDRLLKKVNKSTKLSPKQIEWINKERDTLITRCKVYDKIEPVHKPPGWFGDQMRLQQIQLIIDLHNLEVNK